PGRRPGLAWMVVGDDGRLGASLCDLRMAPGPPGTVRRPAGAGVAVPPAVVRRGPARRARDVLRRRVLLHGADNPAPGGARFPRAQGWTDLHGVADWSRGHGRCGGTAGREDGPAAGHDRRVAAHGGDG